MGLLLPDGRCGRRHGAAPAIGAARPRRGDELTDRIALWLAAVLILLIGADFLITGGATLLFLARKFLDLMDWVAFWR